MTRATAAPVLMVLFMSLAQPVVAQRGPSSGNPRVRAEMAAVLLQSRRYDEAAREYRALVTRDPANYAYRLGLARALAWGKRPREAERELRTLNAQRPQDREVDQLLRSVRQAFEPTAQEAAGWLNSRPGYLPYRRALARALVREGRAGAALQHYEILLAADSSAELKREAIAAQIEGGQPLRAAQLLRRALERAPGDTARRHALAVALTHAQQLDAARAQYDTLIARHPTRVLLLERGQLLASQRNLTAARADAMASISAGANADAYLLLGDMHRSEGDYVNARTAYGYARALRPNDRDIETAYAQLSREERPVIAFLPFRDDGEGWRLRSTAMSDNEGVAYATAGARGVAELPLELQFSADVELRRLAERLPALGDGVTGLALGLGLAREFLYGPLLLRLSGVGGVATHANGAQLTDLLTATGWMRAWALSLEHARGPAYPSLLTRAAIIPPDDEGEPLREESIRAVLGGPLPYADLAVSAQRAQLSDGNRRTTAQGVLRFSPDADLKVLTAVTAIWFTERTDFYWDPLAYVSVAAGFEYTHLPARGVGIAARVLAGPARSVEEIEFEDEFSTTERVALQLSVGGELVHRSEHGEVSAGVTYGSARAGDYRRLEIGLHVRSLQR